MKNYKLIFLSVLFFLMQAGCKKDFLDQKPDLSQTIPKTLADCQSLLDDYDRMNVGYPDHGESAADNYFISDAAYATLADVNGSPEDKYNYSWHPQGEHVRQWLLPYQAIYNANLVLSTLKKISVDEAQYKQVKGSALFFRAFAFYHLAQLFCKPYTAATANSDLGIPLRLTPDIGDVSTRATVKQVYERITEDLTEAVSLLPQEVRVKSRPSKAAAYAALARTYLSMEDYANAGKMADECLKLQSTLIDYNTVSNPVTPTTVSSSATGPSFLRFNSEIIFQAVTAIGMLSQTNIVQIHPVLYNSYAVNDRRKSVFFEEGMVWGVPNGQIVFRGNYDGNYYGGPSPYLFMGLATDEMYLIRGECYARASNTALAMKDLNTLMVKRMEPPYANRTAINATDALVQILTERRKELVFRTLRWTDLRRLNKDPQFAVTLRRDKNTIAEKPLVPNDLRYIFLIPTRDVIELTGMPQNLR